MHDPDESRRAPRVAVPLLVQYRFGALEDWRTDYAINVSQTGMFIAADAGKPVGTRVYVQLTTRDGAHLLQGEGKVVRRDDAGHAIELTGFDVDARRVLEGLVDDALAKRDERKVGVRTRKDRGSV
jgi:hypothetical protein